MFAMIVQFILVLCFCFGVCNTDLDKTETVVCDPATKFQCVSSGRCIPARFKCDQILDCEDGSDEPPECGNSACKLEEFECAYTKKCLPKRWVCDRQLDCGYTENYTIDSSDELFYFCYVRGTKCPPNQSICMDHMTCTSVLNFCDGKKDCPDGSDEGAFCDEVVDAPLDCAYKTRNIPYGKMCYCPEGLRPYRGECVDIDECKYEGTCDHMCKNTNNSFECSCFEGYEIVGKTYCKAVNVPKSEEPSLLISDLYEVSRIHMNGSLYSNLSMPVHTLSVTYNHRNGTVCFVYQHSYPIKNTFTCVEANDFSKSWNLSQPAFSVQSTTHVALDWVSGNWYFIDDGHEIIYVCNSNVQHCVILIDTNSSKPRGIALDPTKGYMFFTKWGTSPASVERAWLDGKERKTLVDRKIIYPYGISVDILFEHVYWVDTYLDSIERISYDGSGRKMMRKSNLAESLYGIVVFEHNVYVSSWRNFSIIRFDKYKRDDHEIILGNLSRPFAVDIYHRQRQPEVEHPCKHDNGGCQHICISMWDNKVRGFAHCLCHPGYKVNPNGKCTVTNPESFLLYSKGKPSMIKGISIPVANASSEEIIPPITNVDYPTIDYDVLTKYIYYSDLERKVIERRKIDGVKKEVVVRTNISSCRGMAIDWIGRNLYWTDEDLGTISVVNLLDYGKRKTVLRDKRIHPRCITVDPNNGFMYWSNWSRTGMHHPGTIEKASMDGTNRTVFVANDLRWPNGLTIDFLSLKLYWCDSFRDKIERINLNGSQREVVTTFKVNHPYGLTVLVDLIFWTEQQKGLIRSYNRNTGETTVVRDENSPLFDIKAFDQNSQITLDIEKFWCTSNISCPDLCLSTPAGPVCVCRDGFVISQTEGVNKCIIKEDENVTIVSSCPSGYFRCIVSGECISNGLVCDGNKDCLDSSDEDNGRGGVCEKKNCIEDEFRCDKNRCIPKYWLCDDDFDCQDETDESSEQCQNHTCPPKQFVCEKSRRCIPQSWVCDNDYDCGKNDTSDEQQNCSTKKCLPFEFPCRNGNCISMDLVCNGENDCHDCSYSGLDPDKCDSSDENLCVEICNITQFYCPKDSICLSKAKRCDGVLDCSDGSDEQSCSATIESSTGRKNVTVHSFLETAGCEPEEFHCEDILGQCIRKQFVCDGKSDCLDGSDERECHFQDDCIGGKCVNKGVKLPHFPSTPLLCNFPNRLCDNGTVCITPEKLCDGRQDCIDHTDEGLRCDEILCHLNKECAYGCYNAPEGFICTCPNDMFLTSDNVGCFYKHRCYEWGICSQHCIITGNHTHKCYCAENYLLQPDHFTCKSTDGSPAYLVFSNRHELRSVDLQTHSVKVLTLGLKNTVALDFYHYNNTDTIYYTDVVDDKIYKGVIVDNVITGGEIVVKSGLATAEGLAVDWIGQNLYWVESSLDQIEVARLNGSFRRTLVTGDIESPRAIALDPRDGWLFWTDWDVKSPRIERCSMSGDFRAIIVQVDEVGGLWPNGLTLDYPTRRVYWIDAKSNAVLSVTYDGDNLQQIIQGRATLDHPFAITLFENNVYWTDWRSNSVMKANRWNGSDVVVIQHTLTPPFDIKVIHPSRQPKGHSPCTVNNGNCSHLCLISINGTYKCACPHIMVLAPDNVTCVENEVFLLYSQPNEIKGSDLMQPYYHTIPTISTPNVISVMQVAYFAETKHIYWIDSQLKEVKRTMINGSAVESVIDTGINSPSGLAVDWLSGTLFISVNDDQSDGGARIVACNLQGEYFTTILSSKHFPYFDEKITSIKSIAVRPQFGQLFWSVMRPNGQYGIFSSDTNGSQIVLLTSVRDNSLLVDPTGLAIDEETESLYWVIKESQSIQFLHLTTHELRTVLLNHYSSPTAAVVYKSRLYYADSFNSTIYIVNKIEWNTPATEDGEIFKNNTGTINSMVMYDPKMQKGRNLCLENKGNCSHLCLPTSAVNRVCKCATGYYVDSTDHTKCVGIEEFILFSINWEIKGLPLNYTDNSTDVLAPISHISTATSIDFDAGKDYIYWADGDHGTITRIRRDGSGRQVVIGNQNREASQTDWLAGVAVDWIGGNLYWTDPRLNVIEVSRLDGMYRKVLLSTNLEKPTSLVLDPARGLLFWSEVGNNKKICQARLNGSNRTVLLSNLKGIINDMALDYATKTVYWCDSFGIYSIKYDGSDMRYLYNQTSSNPFGVTVHEGKIFWIDIIHDHGSVKVAPLEDVRNYTEILSNVGDSLKDIEIFSRSRQIGTNACAVDNGGCSELCLFDGAKATCACSHGLLDKNGKSCKEYSSFVMYSRVDHIDSIHISDRTDLNPPFPVIRSKAFILNTIGLTYDYNNSRLFYSDIQRGAINSVFFNGTDHRVIINHVGSVEGVVYDEITNTLFWTCNSNATVNRLNLTGTSNEKEIIATLTEDDKPRGIDVDSCGMMVYWTNWNVQKPSIQRAYLSGYKLETVIDTDIRMPNALTLDHKAQKLYWADARLDKIERCEYDGTKRVVLNKVVPAHVFDMTIYEDFLFWTDWVMQAVLRCNKYTGDEMVVLRKNVIRPMGIVAVDVNARNCHSNKCRVLNGGCDEVCNLDAAGQVVCSCYRNRKLLKDGYRCTDDEYSEWAESVCLSTEFKCSSGECTNYTNTCDGIGHCMDGSDEDVKYCARRKCRDGYFRCDQNRCIEKELKCNGFTDCTDSSDEMGCPCKAEHFLCDSGECKPAITRCDQIPDCADGSDEKNCGTTEIYACTEDKFRCANSSLCIPKAWMCDHDNDCEDNVTASSPSSDEMHCQFKCPQEQTRCDSKDDCILNIWKCDGITDCSDGSDEKNCESRTCTPSEFRCNTTGQCIPWAWVCDNELDCADSSDESVEQDCINHLAARCPPTSFQCQNRKCIASEYFCDGSNDCGDNSDEPKYCHVCDTTTEFICRNKLCVPVSLVCDGIDDCGDNSDENLTNLNYPTCVDLRKNASCSGNSTFLCSNKVCINETAVCNGVNDCGDNSDEEKCNVNECLTTPNLCQHMCKDKKIGYECLCHAGYQPHPSKPNVCVDINECKAAVKPCSQVCVNERGSHRCECVRGYALTNNNYSCKALTDLVPKLIFTNKHYIREAEFNGNVSLKIHNLTNAVGLDFEWNTKCIYWSEVSTAVKGIRRLCPGNQTFQTLHGSNLENPDGIAVDWIGGNLYWCDKGHDRIEVSRLDGKFRKVLISDKELLEEPRAIVLDAVRGYMYWTDWGHKPYIGKAGMDGKNISIIINDTLGWPNALTINLETNELFWGDAKLDYISVSDLDGKNRRVILNRNINPAVNLHHIFSIAVFEDYIYWTDWESETVERCNKYTGHDCKMIAKLVHRPMDLRVFHPYKQPTAPRNPCENNGGCSGLCLLTAGGGHVCACPDNFVLATDETSCIANCSKSHFICPNTLKCIPVWWKCDNQDDCGDGWDEPTNCPEFKCIPGQFQCDNKECIHPPAICDGKQDCSDGSDENNCDAFTCLDTHFKCSSNGTQKAVCIPNTKRCNGKNDCINGEDELNCKPKSCHENQFKCKLSNICIPLVHACDGDKDCEDNSDEQNCSSATCPSGHIRCSNGRCVPESWICDGQNDCSDGSDETGCRERTCDPTYFKCANNKCIPGRWHCDYRDDCGDRSDEINCTYRNCSESEFRCANGRCIPGASRCDGDFNCADKSDEAECNVACDRDQFQCQHPPHCISLHWRCDGDVDCLDGSDEKHCALSCDTNQYMCKSGECITDSWVCDGENDCSDGSDEKQEVCSTWSCHLPKFRCHNGRCVTKEKVCDGKDNCGDGSDEDDEACIYLDRCMPGNFNCKNGHCIDAKLVCDSENDCGDNSDEQYCGTECAFGTCSQICVIKERNVYSCHCAPGYTTLLGSTYRTCHALGDPAYLAVALDGELAILNPYRNTYNLIKRFTASKPGSKIETLDVLWSREKEISIFWANKHESTIWTSKIPNYMEAPPSPEVVENYLGTPLLTSKHHVKSIAVDWLNKVLYWIESSEPNHAIMVSNLDGRYKTTLIRTGLQKPKDIVVEPIKGRIFWAECGQEARIRVADSNGARRRTFLDSNMYWPVALAIDFPAQRLYWADGKLRIIECVLLNGTDRRSIFQLPEDMKPYKIDLFEDFVYVALVQKNFIARVDKLGDDNMTQISVSNTRISDIVIYQEQKQVVPKNLYRVVPYINNSLCFNAPYFPGSQNCICGDSFVEKIDQYGRRCVCKLGWEGDDCDIPKFKKCGHCLNGGECDPSYKSKCKCPPGYTGLLCEKCDDLVCHQNGGNCTKSMESGASKCVCPDGYSGSLCNISRCNGYCKQGACVLKVDGPKCQCPPGYTGKRCEQLVCEDLCFNGGTCHVFAKNVTCTCPPQYTGRRCEVNLCNCTCTPEDRHCICDKNLPDDCKPRKCARGLCANGGHCHEINRRTYCSCLYPWIGVDCTVRANNDQETCKDYCKNGGVCLNLESKLVCRCKAMWSGPRCAVHSHCVDFCEHGTCQEPPDEDSDPTCFCPDGYSGLRCELQETASSTEPVHPVKSTVPPDGTKHPSTKDDTPSDSHDFILILILIACILAVFVMLYFVVLRKRSNGLFAHVRIQENGTISNPMYLREEVDEDEMNIDHALPLNEKSSAFANPVYDSVYSVKENKSSVNEERRGLLESTLELHRSPIPGISDHM